MQNTSNVGNAEHDGSQGTPALSRQRPYQIAPMLLPGTNIQVRDATDAEFQRYLVTANDLHISEDENDEWSFDDRVRFINHMRKRGIDLFTLPNKNNSSIEQKTIQNNSAQGIETELFAPDGPVSQAHSSTIEIEPLYPEAAE